LITRLILLWSCATLALGFAWGVAALIVLRLLIGLMKAHSYSTNNRVVTT